MVWSLVLFRMAIELKTATPRKLIQINTHIGQKFYLIVEEIKVSEIIINTHVGTRLTNIFDKRRDRKIVSL